MSAETAHDAVAGADLVVTVDEVAQAYKVSRHTIYELCRQNLLPHLRFGRLIRIDARVLRDTEVMQQVLSRFSAPACERRGVRRPSPSKSPRRPRGARAASFDFGGNNRRPAR